MEPVTTSIDSKSELVAAPSPLAKNFARNSAYNLVGWVWPIFLSIVTVPYIVHHLGEEAYGVYAVVSIVAGYLAMMSTPTAAGNIRFLAAAYGRGDWNGLRSQLTSGILVNAAISCAAGVVLYAVAYPLANFVFRVPPVLLDATVISFRIAALSFAFNGIAGSMRSLPIAVRRYELVNAVTLASGTASTAFVVTALYLGYGLVGAVVAMMLSSIVALLGFAIAIRLTLQRIPRGSGNARVVDADNTKQLVSYSGLLFVEHVLTVIGTRIDRTLVAVMLGATAVTYYAIPSRITDIIPGVLGVIVSQLYPLMAEAVASRRFAEAAKLYDRVQRITLWIVCLIGAGLIANAYGLLALWMGPQTADKSWVVLVLLMIVVVSRAPAGVAFQTALGIGRAELNIVLGVGTIVFPAMAGAFLIPRFGIEGAAFAMAATLVPVQLLFAGMIQWKLLGTRSVWAIAMPFVRSFGAMALSVVVMYLVPIDGTALIGLAAKSFLTLFIFVGLSLLFGALLLEDCRTGYAMVSRRLSWMGRR